MSIDLYLHKPVLTVLAYFSFFRHPLTALEIWKYLGVEVSFAKLEDYLKELCQQGVLFCERDYYALPTNADFVNNRIKNEPINKRLCQIAQIMAGILKQIPFVEGLAISGSLSKKGANDTSDIDFFIITQPNRVWFVKACAILFKKLFLLNSRKYLCVNYVLSSGALPQQKVNYFQAIEASSIIPLYGFEVFERFFSENLWIVEFFPNFDFKHNGSMDRKSSFSKLQESFFKGKIGNWLEDKARTLFEKHGKKHYTNKDQRESFFEYSSSASKLFPTDFEKSVMQHFHAKKVEIEQLEPVFH